jgi:hypothetical protein
VRQRSTAMPTRLLVHRTAILLRPRSGLGIGVVSEPMGPLCRSSASTDVGAVRPAVQTSAGA